MSTVQDPTTVTMDSGFVSDGHYICWNGLHGAYISHRKGEDGCPFYTEGNLRVYLCSPGQWAAANGVALNDLPEMEADACRQQGDIGAEPIKWRIQEFITDPKKFTVAEQKAMSIFEIELDDHT